MFLEAQAKGINELQFAGVLHLRTTQQNIYLVDNYTLWVKTCVVNNM